MSRFKIGQKVVALENHSQGYFKKGQIYVVDGFSCCPNCAKPTIHLTIYKGITGLHCKYCDTATPNVRQMFAEWAFAPLQNNADAIEYRLSVSEPEMESLKIKEVQGQ